MSSHSYTAIRKLEIVSRVLARFFLEKENSIAVGKKVSTCKISRSFIVHTSFSIFRVMFFLIRVLVFIFFFYDCCRSTRSRWLESSLRGRVIVKNITVHVRVTRNTKESAAAGLSFGFIGHGKWSNRGTRWECDKW